MERMKRSSRIVLLGALGAMSMPAVSAGLEEIIVTAQRRSENLQEVPISISAVTAQGLEHANITALADLPNLVSGLITTQGAGVFNLFLRGVGNPNQTPGNEASIAVYVDGMYYARLPPALFQLNNVERVEVLKGPQGTLFGRNASGGLIHIVTRTPGQETAIKAEVGYGNFDTYTGSLYVGGGLTENLAADVAVRVVGQ